MRISDWSSDVCSSDLIVVPAALPALATTSAIGVLLSITKSWLSSAFSLANFLTAPSTILAMISAGLPDSAAFSAAIWRSRSSTSWSSPLSSSASGKRSEEHTSELQSLMRNPDDVFCLKKKKNNDNDKYNKYNYIN